MTWLRLEVRRRWRSLLVLALLVALATATVLAAAAGARRGQTAFDRLWASTLPATVTVLPNQPGFDWDKVRALPEVAVLSEFPVNGTPFELTCCPDASVGIRADRRRDGPDHRAAGPAGRAAVRPRPRRRDPRHPAVRGRLPQGRRRSRDHAPGQPEASRRGVGRDHRAAARSRHPGPDRRGGTQRLRVRDHGRARAKGGVLPSPALFDRYRANILGTNGQMYINALIRLKGGTAAIPAFRADLARVTGRSDIDVWNNREFFGGAIVRITRYEAACLLAFAPGRAGGRALPDRPVRGQVHLGDRGRPPGPAGGGHDAAPGRRVGHRAPAAGRGGRGHARRRGGHRGLALDADRGRVLPGTAPGHQRRLADPRPRLGPGARPGGGRIGRRRGPDAHRPPAACRPAPLRRGRGRRGRRARRARGGRRPVRARAGAGPVGGAGPAGPARRGGRRPGRARRLHLLGRGVRRRRQPGAVRPDLAAGYVPRPVRAGLRARRPGPADGGRRPGRHRGRRRAGRRRPVRPGLGGELHLRPGGGQAGTGGAHRRAHAGRAGRDRARPHHRQRDARGHRLGGPAGRRRGAAGADRDRHRLRAGRPAQQLRRAARGSPLPGTTGSSAARTSPSSSTSPRSPCGRAPMPRRWRTG